MSTLDDLIEEARKEFVPTPPLSSEDDIEKQKQREFFFGKKPERGLLQEAWAAEGKCPECGELGYVHLSAFVCKTHGPYEGKLK